MILFPTDERDERDEWLEPPTVVETDAEIATAHLVDFHYAAYHLPSVYDCEHGSYFANYPAEQRADVRADRPWIASAMALAALEPELPRAYAERDAAGVRALEAKAQAIVDALPEQMRADTRSGCTHHLCREMFISSVDRLVGHCRSAGADVTALVAVIDDAQRKFFVDFPPVTDADRADGECRMASWSEWRNHDYYGGDEYRAVMKNYPTPAEWDALARKIADERSAARFEMEYAHTVDERDLVDLYAGEGWVDVGRKFAAIGAPVTGLESITADDAKPARVHTDVDDFLDRFGIADVYRVACGKMEPDLSGSREVKISCCIPGHADRNPSASMNVEDDLWYCYACCEGGDKFVMAARAWGMDHRTQFPELKRRLAEDFGYIAPTPGTPVASHTSPVASVELAVPTVAPGAVTSVVPALEDDDGALGEDFWNTYPELDHIKKAAHARGRSSETTLYATLARVAGLMPHTIKLPPIVGSAKPPCLLVVLLAPSGGGKSDAYNIASELIPAPTEVEVLDLPIGSGEGIVEALFVTVDKEKRQGYYNAVVYIDEGEMFTKTGQRKGAILGPTLRTIYSGGTLGQANASRETKRIVPAGRYTYGVVIAFQPTLAAALFDEAEGGTPQRLLWASATDPDIPEPVDRPAWPGAINWKRPAGLDLGNDRLVDVAPEIVVEVQAVDLGVQRGQVYIDPLDAHRVLTKLKVALAIAVLTGRVEVTLVDWGLAEKIMCRSDRNRARVLAAIKAANIRTNQQRGEAEGERAAVRDETVDAIRQTKVVDLARRIAQKASDADDELLGRKVKRDLTPAQLPYYEEALAHAEAMEWIGVDRQKAAGGVKVVITPGPVKP